MQKETIRPDPIELILKELKDRRDEGGLFFNAGTATVTETVFDIFRDFGFLVKGYKIINNGPQIIQVAHIVEAETDISFARAAGRYQNILATDVVPHEVHYNVKCIRKIAIRTTALTSDYRLWVYW
jgi:hypothetical protein